jgi:filamentous hemagglutinin
VGTTLMPGAGALKMLGIGSKTAKAARAAGATAVPAGATLIGQGDRLAVAAKWVRPSSGVFDVVVHGSDDAFHVLHNGAWVRVDHRALSTLIRKSGWNGEPIRLISCKTGASATGIARRLSDKLGARVTAPSDLVWLHADGRLTIGSAANRHTGTWNVFYPGGASP